MSKPLTDEERAARAAYQRAWRGEHAEQLKEWRARHREENGDALRKREREYMRRYREERGDALREYQREYMRRRRATLRAKAVGQNNTGTVRNNV